MKHNFSIRTLLELNRVATKAPNATATATETTILPVIEA
jgi:hypothetical protein